MARLSSEPNIELSIKDSKMAPTTTAELRVESQSNVAPIKPEGADVEELLLAQSHTYHLVLCHSGTMSLKCAVELGIPDIIGSYGRPVTLSELVTSLPIPLAKASYVQRLMRLLAHLQYFDVHKDGEESYSLTSFSRIFLKDHRTSLAPWLLGVRHPYLTDPWQLMSAWFQQDSQLSLFNMCHGKSIWDLANEKPEFNRLFNNTMASETRILVKAVVACKEAFRGVRSLVDVGGGNGTTARAIAEAYPQIKCTLYDLPHVIATVPESPHVEAVGGNMFDYIPTAHAMFLKQILHDWTDEDCVKILKLCKKSIPAKEDGGKVIIVDTVLNASDDDTTMKDTKLYCDMVMMMSTEGKEREEHEWKKIFMDAGFIDYKITPLGMRSLIEVFP